MYLSEICAKEYIMRPSISTAAAKFFFIFLFSFCGYTAFSWGLTGHRVVAEIAENHLSKKARKGIKELIGKETLAWWSNWSDFIKSDTSYRYAGRWHYINMPGNMSKEHFIDSIQKQPGTNLYSQIKLLSTQVGDKSLSKGERQFALYFLVHLVGDLHQPMHIGRQEDLGGNRVEVSWFGTKTNLHAVWDTDLIDFQQYSYKEYATLLDIANKGQIKQWQESALEEWFYESYVLANAIYGFTPPASKLSYEYNFRFQQTLNDQLLKGGLRLAAILNQCFK